MIHQFTFLAFCMLWSTALVLIAEYLIHGHLLKKIMQPFMISWIVAYTFLWILLIPLLPNPFILNFLLISSWYIVFYTDVKYKLISRFTSLYLVPTGIVCAYLEIIPISPSESIIAACAGYFLFWITNYIFYSFKKCDGLGQGDMDLIACIGSFLGLYGIWFTITISSILGSLLGLCYIIIFRKSAPTTPFGAFLSSVAIGFILLNQHSLSLIAF